MRYTVERRNFGGAIIGEIFSWDGLVKSSDIKGLLPGQDMRAVIQVMEEQGMLVRVHDNYDVIGFIVGSYHK